jgi:hypothetical protein
MITPVKQRSEYVSIKEVHISGMVEATVREQIPAVLAYNRLSAEEKCPNQWVFIFVLDLFDESSIRGILTRGVFKNLFRGCSLE